MTPDELSEALQIAKATTEEMVYSRRVLAKAVLWMNEQRKHPKFSYGWVIRKKNGEVLSASVRGSQDRCKWDFLKNQGRMSSTFLEVAQELGVECVEIELE